MNKLLQIIAFTILITSIFIINNPKGASAESIRDGYIRQASLRTFIQPSDIANLALFLCSEAGDKISGQALSVDGNTETSCI